jgi:hypothetical protein
MSLASGSLNPRREFAERFEKDNLGLENAP